jgi:alpha-amylase/alpha-mannosidase (GH57 family)
MIRLAILWHMHQPLYKEPVSGEFRLPWARMHALKDYYGMVRLVREFPALRATFNLVPSLLQQIEEYGSGQFRDPYFDLVRTPVEQLSELQRGVLLRHCFQNNHSTMVAPHPRFAQLLSTFQQWRGDPMRATRFFSNSDLRDLQVLSQLVWFDEYFAAEPPVRGLLAKERDFTAEDQAAVCDAEAKVIARILPEYRAAAESGQVELSVSAFYHPILPLLCDVAVARQSTPGIALPNEPFHHPEDAREQILRARAAFARWFGFEPRGLWPSEGSVSDEVLALAAEAGFDWTATDEQVLARTLGRHFERDAQGRLNGADVLYRAHVWTAGERPLSMFFRDHQLSDLIGFVYSHLPAEAAADDFIGRVRATARPLTERGQDALVAVILDGENAWEYYADNGRPFLRALYQRLTSSSDIATCTFSEAAGLPGAGRLTSIVPGSWINANFNVWIGAEEDNHSWDQLALARRAWQELRGDAPLPRGPSGARPAPEVAANSVPPEPAAPEAAAAQTAPAEYSTNARDLDLAFELLLAAEGSDWNWWYGPEHHSENEPDFDSLYRALLTAAYRTMGRTPPSSLLHPITKAAAAEHPYEPPSGWIHPHIDGHVTSYFEWLGAAIYSADRRSSTMHGRQFELSSLRLGYDSEAVYARLDFVHDPAAVGGELRFEFRSKRALLLTLTLANGRIVSLHSSVEGAAAGHDMGNDAPNNAGNDARNPGAGSPLQPAVEARIGEILEVSVPRALIEAGDEVARVSVMVRYFLDGLPRETLPSEGSIELQLQPEETVLDYW